MAEGPAAIISNAPTTGTNAKAPGNLPLSALITA